MVLNGSERELNDRMRERCSANASRVAEWSQREADRRSIEDVCRHYNTLRRCQEVYKGGRDGPVRVLLAGGVAYGSEVVALDTFMKSSDCQYTAKAIESPNSAWLGEGAREMLEEYGVELIEADLRRIEAQALGDPDIILLTEIIEHLDHSVVLKLLRMFREEITSDPLLVITTPNMLSLKRRIKVAVGYGQLFWGDGCEQLEDGLFGHVSYYSERRLKRLLSSCGWQVARTAYFNCLKPRGGYLRRAGHSILQAVSIGHSAFSEYIFVAARP